MALRPKIFISHAKEDEKHAKAIHEFLSKRNTNPWISSENLLAGQNWRAGIEKAVFIIPVRLERCQIRHSRLSQLHYIDMFPDLDDGLERIYSTICTVMPNSWSGTEISRFEPARNVRVSTHPRYDPEPVPATAWAE